jgi:hypothetical protein
MLLPCPLRKKNPSTTTLLSNDPWNRPRCLIVCPWEAEWMDPTQICPLVGLMEFTSDGVDRAIGNVTIFWPSDAVFKLFTFILYDMQILCATELQSVAKHVVYRQRVYHTILLTERWRRDQSKLFLRNF